MNREGWGGAHVNRFVLVSKQCLCFLDAHK